jgi:hypothetical protein
MRFFVIDDVFGSSSESSFEASSESLGEVSCEASGEASSSACTGSSSSPGAQQPPPPNPGAQFGPPMNGPPPGFHTANLSNDELSQANPFAQHPQQGPFPPKK